MRDEFCVIGNTQSIQPSNIIHECAEKEKCGEVLGWTFHLLGFVARGPRAADHVTGKRL